MLWRLILLASGIAIACAQNEERSRQHAYGFGNVPILAIKQTIAKYYRSLGELGHSDREEEPTRDVFIGPETAPLSFGTCSAPVPTALLVASNTTDAVCQHENSDWHSRKVDYREFSVVETLQQDRMQVVTHPDFNAPVLIKMARLPHEMPPLEHEVVMYRRLHGAGVTPELLGYVTEGRRTIGFITEYVRAIEPAAAAAERSNRRSMIQGCLAALRRLHERGIAHGDAHDGNCLVRADDGSAVLIDFELAVETWAAAEFERDLDIMGRCIQAMPD